jgi:quercetin dioxygenase-like cupin family protein
MIDFTKIPVTELTNFKGGNGTVDAHIFADKDIKIMRSTLHPGGSIGLHAHEGSCEVVYVLKGEGTCLLDSKKEVVKAGQVHYCPNGSTHLMKNESQEDLEVLCVVPTFSQK